MDMVLFLSINCSPVLYKKTTKTGIFIILLKVMFIFLSHLASCGFKNQKLTMICEKRKIVIVILKGKKLMKQKEKIHCERFPTLHLAKWIYFFSLTRFSDSLLHTQETKSYMMLSFIRKNVFKCFRYVYFIKIISKLIFANK